MRLRIQILLTLITALCLSGCGGGSISNIAKATGRAVVTIVWPDRSRLIPAAANSISIKINEGATTIAQKIVARPSSGNSSTVTFDSLPSGSYSAVATAFPNADGSGTAQATGTVPLTLTVGQTTAFTITMASTVDHIELSAAKNTVVSGGTLQVAVTAKDAAGSVVLLAPGKLQWASSNTGSASVNGSGLVTGAATGNADISVSDTESGKSAKISLTVTVPGAIAFQPPALYPVSGNELMTADFDGDGNLDLAIGTNTSLLVMYGTGGGAFGTAQTVLTWTGGVRHLALADMNGDGRTDIVAVVDAQFLVLNNLGSRNFAAPIAMAVTNIYDVATGDFDGDGKPDIVAITSNPGSTATDVHIFRNNGSGNYSQVSGFRDIWIIVHVKVVDLDGDGKQDLVTSIVTDIGDGSGVHVYWGDGTGHFTGGPSIGTGSFNVSWTAIADFNADGKLDIAIADTTDGGVSVIPNTGGRTFGTPAHYGGPDGPDNLEAPDFDGDGRPDIVWRGGPGITVLRNQNGLFPNFQKVLAGGSTISMAVGDYNKDGKPDVALTTDAGVSILLNSTP